MHRHVFRDVRRRVFTSGRGRRLSFVCHGNTGRHSDANAGANTCPDSGANSQANSQTRDSRADPRHAGASSTGREHMWRPE